MKKTFTILFLAILSCASNAQEIKGYSQFAEKSQKIVKTELNQESKINQFLSDAKKVQHEKEAENNAKFIADDMDWQILYNSGHSSEVITAWVNLYTHQLKNVFKFREDFQKITEKIKDPAQYKDFAEQTASSLTKNNKIHYINFVADLVRGSGKIENYTGSLAAYMKATLGTQAPDLVIEENNKNTVLKSNELANGSYSKTMLLFYATGCGPCENLLQQLPSHLENIKAKGVRLIALSGDEDEKVFKDKAKDFQWKDVFCDYKGIRGANFQNYAITGTPTIFLLDHNGKILLRTAALEEVLGYINNAN